MRPNPKSKSGEYPAGYSPRPAITITVHPGQRILIVGADASGDTGGAGHTQDGDRPDESPSPSLRRDQR